MHELSSNDVVFSALGEMNQRFSHAFEGTALVLKSPMRFGLDDLVRSTVEALGDLCAGGIFLLSASGLAVAVSGGHHGRRHSAVLAM